MENERKTNKPSTRKERDIITLRKLTEMRIALSGLIDDYIDLREVQFTGRLTDVEICLTEIGNRLMAARRMVINLAKNIQGKHFDENGNLKD